MTLPAVVNLASKLALMDEHWSPRIVARMNSYEFKVVKFKGVFVWHRHPDTDETFLVLDGSMQIEFRNGAVGLGRGEMVVVPKGVEHRTIADSECSVLLIEPAGTVNTGDAGGRLTAPEGVWI